MLSFGRGTVVALDIGSAGVKAVRMEAGPAKPGREPAGRGKPQAVVARASRVDIPPPADGDRDGRPDARARVIAALGDALRELGVQPGKVRRLVTSLPGSQVSIKQIKCLALPDEEIRSALAFEARKHLPMEGDVLMDFQVLGRRDQELDVLLVATTKQAVTAHLALLEACGLKGGIIEAPSLALWNAWLGADGNGSHAGMGGPPAPGAAAAEPGGAPVAFLQVGASATTLTFFHRGGLFFTREIPIAGDRFTDDLRQNLGSDFLRAEKAKVAHGLFHQHGAGGAAAAGLELESEQGRGLPSPQNLAREIQRSIRFYLKESGQPRLGGLALGGGAAADKGLREFLEKELAMRIDPFRPGAGVEARADSGWDGDPAFAQALGMALRGVHEFFPHQPE